MGTQPEDVVLGLCDAFAKHDAEALRQYFTDDVVYHNIPMDPAVGLEAAMAVIDMFLAVCEELEFQVHHLAVDGETVLTERTDVFTIGGKTAPLPVMGAFRVVDGKIAEWRDYFDMGQVTTIFSGG